MSEPHLSNSMCPSIFIYDRHLGPMGGLMLRANVKPAQLNPSRSGIRRELPINFGGPGCLTIECEQYSSERTEALLS